MTESDLQDILQNTTDFPALSEVAAEIVDLTTRLSAPVHQVAELLQADQALLKRMLVVINSPFYKFSDPITRIDQAITLMGYKKICMLAVALSLMELFPPEQSGEFDQVNFWKNAVCTAVSAAEIAARLPKDLPEEAFTVGLLQDAGILLLGRCRPLTYGRALGFAQAKEIHMAQAEREILGLDHAVAGAVLCRHWKLPALFANIVRDHHFFEFGETSAENQGSVTRVANLASLFTAAFYDNNNEQLRQSLYERAQTFFKFSPARVDEILATVPDQLQKIGTAFAIPVEDQEEIPEETPYLEYCSKCGAPGGTKFCKECGANLEIQEAKPRLSMDKILIAEDSAATRLALSILIRRMGYSPVEALNGADALRLARKERPGMILMDIQMPGMSGLEALQKIRQEADIAHIPIVMLTSITSAETVIEALQAGANDYVVKPFTASIVQDRVQKHMDPNNV
ncbi:MAG: HDOD domain-containing protein [bacterium]|nr:HDOD domain-containing protein [bacterium]